MRQKPKLGLNFGFRGWMLMLYLISAFLLYQAFTNFPMNMLAQFYCGEDGATTLSTIYTAAILLGIVMQIILASFIGKIKSIKNVSLILGVIAIAMAFCVALIPAGTVWSVCYFLVSMFSNVYAFFAVCMLIGQWFPARKGVFMGIATFAFPICNGLMGPFASTAFNGEYMAASHGIPNVFGAFLPYLIAAIVGWLLGLLFVKDYPEQCGCYRDNDKSFTAEKAQAMMAAEIENKRTTVWTIKNTLRCGQFWLVTVPMGTLLMCAVGMMTQTNAIIGAYPALNFSTVMAMVMIFALIGSYVLGLIDGKFGTKLAITISVAIMLISGILGGLGNTTATLVSIILLAIFMGAGSNFNVSAAAQYWRREDFPSVYAVVNPIANVLQCFGSMMVAFTLAAGGVTLPFWATTMIAVIALILILCFKPSKVKAADDKYRTAAGKPMDDALVSRR